MRFAVWWRQRYTFCGTALGLILLWLSMTPSLLPRGPLFQSLVSGGSAAIGYGIGVLLVFLVRYMRSRDSSPPAPYEAWLALGVLTVVGTALMQIRFAQWQDELRDLMGVEHLGWWAYLQIVVLSLVLWYLLVEAGKLIGRLVLGLTRRIERFAPPRVSGVLAALLVVAVTVSVIDGVVLRGSMRVLNSTFSKVNEEQSTDLPRPTSGLRSGGAGSAVSWESLGNQGRRFISSGPTERELTEFNGTPAMEPIRAYAGLDVADELDEIAATAAAELVRAGGLRRQVVAVATTTGTGWINQAEADALEYMYNGDSAIVSMQYSFLPSWLSFLVDKEKARAAGEALFEAVSEKVLALPPERRPKLVVFGESLGSFGAEAAFGTPNNLLARTDGALFSGPTFDNSVWVDVTDNRDAGSPQWLPAYRGGANIRFAAEAADLARGDAEWGFPRVVYLQRASDPIGKWSTDLILHRPDWLREERGRDVLPGVRWFPIVTFLQVTADMAVSVNVPDGHGHRYVADVADAWAAILAVPGWTPDKTARLRGILDDAG